MNACLLAVLKTRPKVIDVKTAVSTAVRRNEIFQSRAVDVIIVRLNIIIRKNDASSIRSATAQSGVRPRASTAESGMPAPHIRATTASIRSAASTEFRRGSRFITERPDASARP